MDQLKYILCALSVLSFFIHIYGVCIRIGLQFWSIYNIYVCMYLRKKKRNGCMDNLHIHDL